MASGESIVSGLIRSYVQRSSDLLSRLESDETRLSPEECFDLLLSLGYLRHGTWLADVTPADQALGPPYGRLKERLAQVVKKSGKDVVTCLEKGILGTIGRIDAAIIHIRPYLEKKELSSTFTSYEFNEELLSVRDHLGYAQILLEETGQPLSDSTVQRLKDADNRLRSFLDAAIKQFQESEDDPTPQPDKFPLSFWWRRHHSQ